jgi:hypothetical protein
MPLSTAALERAGIRVTIEELEAVVNAAIEQAIPPYGHDDARQALTGAELAFLADAGVGADELAPLEAGAESPKLRGAAKNAALLASVLSVQEAAPRLGVDASRIRQRLAKRSLYGVRVDGGWRLPLFQFTDDLSAIVPGFGVIAPALADLHPVDVANWFTQPHVDLAVGEDQTRVSPRDWLLSGGDPQELLPLAEELHGVA